MKILFLILGVVSSARAFDVTPPMGAFSLGPTISCSNKSSINFDSGTEFIDCTNNRVGLLTTSPNQLLHLSSGTLLIDGNVTNAFLAPISTQKSGFGTANPATTIHLSSGTLTIDGNVSPAIRQRCSANTNASLTYGTSSCMMFEAGSNEVIWGSQTASPYSIWLQNRNSSNQAVNLRLLPLGGSVGIGTDEPSTKLHMSSGTLTIDGNTAVSERIIGHSEWNGASPSIASCGTGASIVGSDTAGHVVIGTGGSTVCAITFVNAFTNRPHCVAQDETTATLIKPVNATTSLTLTASLTAGDTVQYWCPGN